MGKLLCGTTYSCQYGQRWLFEDSNMKEGSDIWRFEGRNFKGEGTAHAKTPQNMYTHHVNEGHTEGWGRQR